MDKFMIQWQGYAREIEKMHRDMGPRRVRKVLDENTEFDTMIKEKFNEEQFSTLSDFKNMIYESERKKKDDRK
jgi:hypothetical protein